MNDALRQNEASVSQAITLQQLSPRILGAYFYLDGNKCPKGSTTEPRYVKDYEIEYITDTDHGKQKINGIEYLLEPGQIIFRKPGDFTYGTHPYCCYFFAFDMLGNTGKSNRDRYDFHRPTEFQPLFDHPLIQAIPTCFKPTSGTPYEKMFRQIFEKFIDLDEMNEFYIRGLIIQMLVDMAEDAKNFNFLMSIQNSPYSSILQKGVEFIESHYMRKITLNDIAKEVALSHFYFHKIFTKNLNMTPLEYILETRLSKAKELLITSYDSINDISAKCGFDNCQYFSNTFKKHVNMTPTGFRKKFTEL